MQEPGIPRKNLLLWASAFKTLLKIQPRIVVVQKSDKTLQQTYTTEVRPVAMTELGRSGTQWLPGRLQFTQRTMVAVTPAKTVTRSVLNAGSRCHNDHHTSSILTEVLQSRKSNSQIAKEKSRDVR